jgi:hypothetical protein
MAAHRKLDRRGVDLYEGLRIGVTDRFVLVGRKAR